MYQKNDFDLILEDLFNFADSDGESQPRKTTERPESKPIQDSANSEGKSHELDCQSSTWLPFKNIRLSKQILPHTDGIYFLKWNCRLYVPGFYNTIRIDPKAAGVPPIVNEKICYLQSNAAENTILYIGKSENLDFRLRNFERTARSLTASLVFSPPIKGPHRGGRYIWTLRDAGGNSAYGSIFYRWVLTYTLTRWYNSVLSRGNSIKVNPHGLKCKKKPTCVDFERLFLLLCSGCFGYSSFVLPFGNDVI